MAKPSVAQRNIAAIAVIVLGVGIALWASTHSASYEICQQERHTSRAEQPTLGQKIAYFIVCEGVAVDNNGDLLTALATIAVAGFTLTLWLATSQQGRLTQQSIDLARAEFTATHRPRVRVRFIRGPIGQPDNTCVFRVTVANIGETPANIIEHTFQIIEHDGWEGVEVAVLEPPVEEDVWLASGEEHVFERRTRDQYWPDSKLTLIVIGDVTYTDEAGSRGVKRRIGFGRDYDHNRGSYSKSAIYGDHDYRD